jgi:hypothetical protein
MMLKKSDRPEKSIFRAFRKIRPIGPHEMASARANPPDMVVVESDGGTDLQRHHHRNTEPITILGQRLLAAEIGSHPDTAR